MKVLNRKDQRKLAFEAMPRKELRELAKSLGIRQGRNKANTVANLVAAKDSVWVSVKVKYGEVQYEIY